MAIDDKIVAWSGAAYRHLPRTVTKAADVLNFSYAGRAADNRWNVKGQPTLYLAGDMGVALAEWSRHFVENTNPALAMVPVSRMIWRLTLDVPHVLDLRDIDVWAALSLANAPECFLDLPISQTISEYLRRITPAQALLVPSVAMLDRLDRWNLVLFLEKLPSDPRRFITSVQRSGTLQAPTGVTTP
jgi:RES domain-containing protein